MQHAFSAVAVQLSNLCVLKSVHWHTDGRGSDYLCPRLTSHPRLQLAQSNLLLPQCVVCLIYTLHVKRHNTHPDRTNSSHCITFASRCLDTLNKRKLNCCDTCKCVYTLQSNLLVRFQHDTLTILRLLTLTIIIFLQENIYNQCFQLKLYKINIFVVELQLFVLLLPIFIPQAALLSAACHFELHSND